jgi:hypothetical protein
MSDVVNTVHVREKKVMTNHAGMWSSVYGMAFIGAAIYWLQRASSFGDGVWGFFKAIFWPAVLMYKLLEYLKL